MTDYAGGCHCGAIGFLFNTSLAPADWSIRACQCAFCRAHGALSTSDPRGSLRFTAVNPRHLQRYRFALKTADFLLCKNCGVYVGAVIETGAGLYGIINTRALAATPDDIAVVAAVSYEDEREARRISRREERWTPVESVPES